MTKLFIKSQGQGDPLVLLHGWGFNGDIWQQLATVLASSWQVYQIDLPGHGYSPLGEFSLPRLTDTLASQVPPNAVWLGWSLGGLVALAMARWRPTFLRALVLIASSPRFVTAPDWSHAMTPAVLENFSLQLQEDTAGTLRRFLALQVKGSTTARQQLRVLNQWLARNPLPQPAALQAGLTLLQQTDLRAELAQIHCPALLCLGGHDALVPVGVGNACQQWWPSLRKVVIKPAAHIPFLSHTEIFLPILQGFLHELPPRPS
jgi:pimeloyl-[acyl-carrier protein] methyl ester esterase